MDSRMNAVYHKRNRFRQPRKADSEKRERANMRERARVSEMNGMFQVLIELLPPSTFRDRFSRAQMLREAASYIHRLQKYLDAPESSNAFDLFPHIFSGNRKTKKVAYRRQPKIDQDGRVSAFISRHDLPDHQNVDLLPMTHQPTVYQYPMQVLPPTNVYISAYF